MTSVSKRQEMQTEEANTMVILQTEAGWPGGPITFRSHTVQPQIPSPTAGQCGQLWRRQDPFTQETQRSLFPRSKGRNQRQLNQGLRVF